MWLKLLIASYLSSTIEWGTISPAPPTSCHKRRLVLLLADWRQNPWLVTSRPHHRVGSTHSRWRHKLRAVGGRNLRGSAWTFHQACDGSIRLQLCEIEACSEWPLVIKLSAGTSVAQNYRSKRRPSCACAACAVWLFVQLLERQFTLVHKSCMLWFAQIMKWIPQKASTLQIQSLWAASTLQSCSKQTQQLEDQRRDFPLPAWNARESWFVPSLFQGLLNLKQGDVVEVPCGSCGRSEAAPARCELWLSWEAPSKASNAASAAMLLLKPSHF